MINAIAIDDEPLALKVIEALSSRIDGLNLIRTFTHPYEAHKYLQNFPVDLLFVDIQMPSISGLDLVKQMNQQSMVIFTTAFSEYAVASYEVNAIDYLLKPIGIRRFQQAMKKAEEYFAYKHNAGVADKEFIFIRADLSLVKIKVDDIIYIEGLADYVKIFIKDQKTVVARTTMKDMLERLPESKFLRVHRSYIVPLQRVLALRSNAVILKDNERIPVGTTYVLDVKKALIM